MDSTSSPKLVSAAELRALRLALAWLATLIAFLALALHATSGQVGGLDLRLAELCRSAPAFLDPLFHLDNALGRLPVYAALVLGLCALLAARRHDLEAAFVLSSFVPVGLQYLVKQAVREPPPFISAATATQYSFPSGHVVAVAVLCGFVWAFTPLLTGDRALRAIIRSVCIVLLLSVGSERVWRISHWPGDSLAGYLFALLFLIPALEAYRLIKATAYAPAAEPLREEPAA